MKILCTRYSCPNPNNDFPELDDNAHLRTAQQKYCTSCGMHLILGQRYLPIQLLGKGGFGAAFLAIDRHSPTLRKCVVKQFKPEGNLTKSELEKAQEMFEKEALVLETLGNRNERIPNLFAFFPLIISSFTKKKEEEQYFYLVQEFIDGEDLEKELGKKNALSQEEVKNILLEILPILKFVHNNNSIHRDIKPSNIIRDKQGILHLLDFGAVKMVATQALTNLQSPSTTIYSINFAPPEQIKGSKIYPCSDLYALAVTCIYLLTGKDTSELYDDYHNQWQWHQYLPDLDPNFASVLDKMLLATPSERFQSADEVLQALTTNQNQSLSPKGVIGGNTTQIQTSNQSNSFPTTQAQPQPQPQIKRQHQPLPLFPIITGLAFIGFEMTLISIAMFSLFTGNLFNVAIGITFGIFGLIIFALFKRIIEKWDFVIFGLITLAIVKFVPLFNSILIKQSPIILFILPVIMAIICIFIGTLFLVIYKLISRIF